MVALGSVSAGAALARPATTEVSPALTTGWWWAGGPLLEPASGVPDGGLVVASALGRPTAFAAARASVDRAARSVVLHLAVHDATGTPALVACPAITPWQPSHGGDLDDAPAYDCTATSAPVRVDGDRAEVDLTELAGDGVLDVVLVPDPLSVAPFSVTFDRPATTALAVELASSPTTVSTLAPVTTPPVTTPPVTAPPPGAVALDPPATTPSTSEVAAPPVTIVSAAPPERRAPHASLAMALVVATLVAGTATGMARTALAGRT